MKTRIAIVTTHPIQYQIPWFRALEQSGEYEMTVFFAMIPDAAAQGVGFDTSFAWDIPLLDGYKWKLLPNKASNPGLSHFSGCDTPSILQGFKELSLDAVIVTGWQSKMLIQGIRAASKLKIPIIVRGESNNMRPRPWHKKLIHRILLKRFAAFLCIGKSNRQFYLSNGVPENRLHAAPYFVENERFIDATSNSFKELKETGRKNLGIAQDDYCFIYSGKLSTKKNVMSLIDGVFKLYQKSRRFHFLIVGDGEMREELQYRVNKEKLPVTFAGFKNQTEIPEMYAIADCLLLGSDFGETWGLVVNEAMVCGLPAIVSDRVGCGQDLICSGATGFVFPYGDSDTLSRKMQLMIDDPENSKKMGANARKIVIQNYNVAVTVDATKKAIKSLK